MRKLINIRFLFPVFCMAFFLMSTGLLAYGQQDVTIAEQNSDYKSMDVTFYKIKLTQDISVDFKNTPMEDALREIADKSGLILSYRRDYMTGKLVSFSSKSISVSNALEKVLGDTGLDYLVSRDGYLIIKRKNREKGTEVQKKSSASTIHGVVTDASNGFTLPGVNIIIKGTSIGTATNRNGRYTLDVPSLQDTLVISYIGYQKKEVPINGRTVINVSLNSQAISGKELVVVGYGTQSKVSLTSAVEQINGDQVVKRPVNSIQQALQGKLPGLTILDSGGSPGDANTNIVIRGVHTPYTPTGLSQGNRAQVGSNGPLVIVDGVEQPFANINPEDIASISVLKDASSTAIYGARGGNGVILITTKRAKEGKVTATYDFSYAIQKSIMHPVHMDIGSYLRLQDVAYVNAGQAAPYSDQYIKDYVKGSVSDPIHYPLPFDWYNVMLKPAPQANHSLSVSGGSKNFRARMSLRYQDQGGIIANTNSKLSEGRVNTNFTVTPHIKASADLDYRYEDRLQPYDINNIFTRMMQNSIWAVPKYPNGIYGGGAQGNNPLLLAEKGGYSRINSNYIIANLKGEWDITKGLSFTIQFAGRSTDIYGKTFENTWQTEDLQPDSTFKVKKSNLHNRLTEARNFERNFTLNDLLRYSTVLGNHSIKLLAGYSQIEDNSSHIYAYRQDFYNNEIQSLSEGINDATKDNGGGDEFVGLRSYFGRINYSYMDKYLFEADARYDGSSLFTGSKKYTFFPSFSAGWRISQEKFWNSMKKYVNELKIRGSWGEAGNNTVPAYSYYSTLSLVTYDFSGNPVQGYQQQKMVNPNLTWETDITTDIGVDADFFNSKISVSADYYKKRSKGILLSLPIPATLGLSAAYQNAGIVDNTGWEFKVGSNNRFGKFNLNTSLNFSIDNNKVIDLVGTGPYYYGGNDFDPQYITAVGHPINAIWGYKTDGFFQSDQAAASYPQFMEPAKAGDVKYLDLNKDGVIDAKDETYIGNSFPKYTYGGSINLGYKGFSLDLVLQGAADVGMVIARAYNEEGIYEGYTPDVYTNNYWTPQHTNAEFPRPVKHDMRNHVPSDLRVLNASYIRLKNAQLSYMIPGKLTTKVGINQMSIYVSGTNLLTISELNKWHLDPEAASGWQNYYPQVAMYTVGIHLQF